jgi:hypothetical protein
MCREAGGAKLKPVLDWGTAPSKETGMNPSQRFLSLSGASLLALLALNIVLAVLGPAAFEALRRSLETLQSWLQAAAV